MTYCPPNVRTARNDFVTNTQTAFEFAHILISLHCENTCWRYFYDCLQITSSTGTCALAQQKKPCAEPLATSTPVKKSPSHSRFPLDDSGFFEQQPPARPSAEYATNVSGYDCDYRPPPTSDKWQKPPSASGPQQHLPAPVQANRTWPDTTAYCEYQSTGWPQETPWHGYGPLTYGSSAIDQRYQEPMMFYSWSTGRRCGSRDGRGHRRNVDAASTARNPVAVRVDVFGGSNREHFENVVRIRFLPSCRQTTADRLANGPTRSSIPFIFVNLILPKCILTIVVYMIKFLYREIEIIIIKRKKKKKKIQINQIVVRFPNDRWPIA